MRPVALPAVDVVAGRWQLPELVEHFPDTVRDAHDGCIITCHPLCRLRFSTSCWRWTTRWMTVMQPSGEQRGACFAGRHVHCWSAAGQYHAHDRTTSSSQGLLAGWTSWAALPTFQGPSCCRCRCPWPRTWPCSFMTWSSSQHGNMCRCVWRAPVPHRLCTSIAGPSCAHRLACSPSPGLFACRRQQPHADL